MLQKKVTLLAAIALVLILIPASSADVEWTGAFVLGSCCEPNSLDPAAMGISQTEGYVINAMYEGLTQYSREGEIVPRLATSWEISDDALTYTLSIREGVQFHDGSTLDAEAVKLSLDRHKALGLGNLGFILAPVASVTVVDDMTVAIQLNSADFQFWAGLPHIKILSAQALAEHDMDGDMAGEFFRENAVGTGPYQLVRWDPGRQTEMEAFPDYWGGWEGPHIERFIARYGLDYTTRLLLMEDGEVHLIDWAGLSDVRRAATSSAIHLNFGNPLQGFYHFMKQDGPLANKQVRQALLHAYPYHAMIEVMGGFAVPLTSPALAGTIGHCDVFEPVQDLDKARELLAEAGYADGFSVRQAYRHANEPRRFAAVLFQEALAELNIEVMLDDIPWGTFIDAQRNFDTAYDMSSHWLNIPIPYAGEMLFRLNHSALIDTGTGNWAWYSNPAFDALLEEAPTLAPGDPRIDELLCEAQQILIDEAVVIPVMLSQYIDLTHSSVRGYQYDPYGFPGDLHPYDIWLEG
ncbi:MAG: ABC transporter substrate-binding protein [Chloroflexi bacterium]|nr:ABC transporter substrate-binding protein [Chloroflexota bacterium]